TRSSTTTYRGLKVNHRLAISYPSFCFTISPPTQISTLSLHDALPILIAELMAVARSGLVDVVLVANDLEMLNLETLQQLADWDRSEEHTSELQSRFDLVCRLLLEKKKRRNLKNII